TRAALQAADRILLLLEPEDVKNLSVNSLWQELLESPDLAGKTTLLCNKIDLSDLPPLEQQHAGFPLIRLSAKTGQGLELLRQHLLRCVGMSSSEEGGFSARRRHLDALHRARNSLA